MSGPGSLFVASAFFVADIIACGQGFPRWFPALHPLTEEVTMAYLSKEEQRQRAVEVVRQHGVDCPDLVVRSAKPILGSGLLKYRYREGAPVQELHLTSQQARYIGIDMSVRDFPETGH
jgi:hypothetical protein